MGKIKNDKDGCAVRDIVLDDDEEDDDGYTVNTFQDSIKELAHAHYDKFPDKSSNISASQRVGMVTIDVVNDFSERNFGYRFNSLDVLVKQTNTRTVSEKGFGLLSFIELMKGINASFEQTQIPEGLGRLIKR